MPVLRLWTWFWQHVLDAAERRIAGRAVAHELIRDHLAAHAAERGAA